MLVPLFVALALLVAPITALAQDDASELPEYPGPFDESSDEAGNDSDDSATVPDEVLSKSLTAAELAQADASSDTPADRSIDYIGDDVATSFIAPDISPSTSTPNPPLAAAGGSTGLANTGSDVEPIIAISVGLLAVGGSALVGSRRRVRDFFR